MAILTYPAKLISKALERLGRVFLNLSKQLYQSPQEKRVLPWIKDKGDKTFRLNYDLHEDSLVFDLCGYEGQWASDIFMLGNEPLRSGLAHTAYIVGWSFIAVSSVLVLIAAVDVPFQLWDHANKLKMTKQEVKDEQKQTDGSPEIKSRIRAVQRQMAQQRMMEDIPDADVIVTNPTHYAVALRYDQDGNGAPAVVAKGADLIAAQIRKVANAHDVAIVEAPPLARALYFNTDIGQEIPAGLYVAVAQLLAYVYQLKNMQAPGQEVPAPPDDLPVPDELLRDH